MNDLSKKTKIIKIIYVSISIIIMLVGLFFSFLIAELDDAPGFVIFGTTITLVGASVIYGIGEIIIQLNQNNNMILDIHKELMNSKKL